MSYHLKKYEVNLLANELNSILIFHATLNQGQSNQHWGSVGGGDN